MKRSPSDMAKLRRLRRQRLKQDDNIGIYLDVAWSRTFRSKWMQDEVNLNLYKGHILLSVDATSERAKQLAKHAGVNVGGVAWMRADDIDATIQLLCDARVVLRKHQTDIRKIASCEACRTIFAGVCDRHRPLFKKYKRPKQTRGIR